MINFPSLALLTTGLLCTALAWAQDEPATETRRIREIRIERSTVYTKEQAEESSWAASMNRYHNLTRESVIRTALLFSEGDVFDEELLVASERTLRRFSFLNEAEILVVPVGEQTVDVEVRTKDAWSLEPGVNFEGGGGLATVSAHLIDFNVAGYGKKLFGEAIWESDVGTTWNFGYSDYQLFRSHWVGTARYKSGPLVESTFLQARLPLFSPDSKWAYGGYAYKSDSIIRRFEEGEEISRFDKDQDAAGMFLTRSFGPRYKKTNMKLQLKYLKADYSDLGAETTTELPPDQENLTPTINLSRGETKWSKVDHFNKQGMTEDVWLGHRYGAKLGYGIPIGDSIELWDVRAYFTRNASLGNQQLLELSGSVSSEVVRNTFVNLSAKYYRKFSWHTVATNFSAKIGNDLDSSRQLTLGADSGLRGYPARQFTGDSQLLMNLEDRQHWGAFTIGVPVNLGTVVFVDAGNVWKKDEDIDLTDLNWSTGVGLRLSLVNMPKQPILRVDVGYGFSLDDFAVTVGTEQHF